MQRLLNYFRAGRAASLSPWAPPVPYEVACECGHLLRGTREVRHQRPRCSRCGRMVFILPCSPLMPVAPPEKYGERMGAPPFASAPPRFRIRRRPILLLLGGGALLALAGLLYSMRGSQSPGPDVQEFVRAIQSRTEEGRKLLAAGSFELALEKFDAAAKLRDSQPTVLPGADDRQLVNLRREAALLTELLHESLGEILTLAAGIKEDKEWQTIFARHYRGKAVIFEAELRRDAAGRRSLGYHVRAGAEPAELDISDLALVEELPSADPRRVLLGCRLASVRREPPGKWIVRFEPNSVMLLTPTSGAGAYLRQLGIDLGDQPANQRGTEQKVR